jgi:hypothetical protein
MGNSKILWVIIVVLAGALIWFFFMQGNSSYIATTNQTQNTSSENNSTSKTNTVSDTKTTTTSVAPTPKVVSTAKVAVTGQFSYSEDPNSPALGKLCFSVNNATAGKITKFSGGTKTPYFCFGNQDEALALFNVQKGFSDGSTVCSVLGPASVEIKNYQLLTGDVGGYDSAILTKVIFMGPQSFAPCK